MAGEAIFQGQDGRQIKFFIQKDLTVERIETLQTQIMANGGRVETKVPIHGYVLIELKSPEGERLIDCWESSDRPLRNFVPYTFVAACLDARKLIPQVFRKNGKALKFHIHSCITNEKVIEALRTRISHCGGNPFAAELEADIIIADESTPSFSVLNERFEHHHNTFVEGIPWVKQCVESGVYENTPVIRKNLGGRIPGNKRTEFTPQDDNLLAGYIASRLPDQGMRGRTGNKLYHELCTRLDLYPWAEHHPWQSWRERYKNNSARFNKLIATYLEHHPVPESGKGLYGFTRVRASPLISQPKQPIAVQIKSPSKVPLRELDMIDKAEEGWGSQWPIIEGNDSPAWGKTKRKTDDDNTEESNKRKQYKYAHSGEHEQSSQSTCTTLPEFQNQEYPQETTNGSDSRSTKLNELADPTDIVSPGDTPRSPGRSPVDTNKVIGMLDSSNEDITSEGDDVGPETQALLDASKAMLMSCRHSSQLTSIPPEKDREPDGTRLTVDPSTTWANAKGDDTVKLALLKIANECRFLFNEVMEEYGELGQDLDATRSFFEEIRACIDKKKSMRNKPLR